MMQHYMETRLERFAPRVRYRTLEEDDLKRKTDAIRSRRLRLTAGDVLATASFAALDAAEARQWLDRALSLVAPDGELVQLVWPAHRFGVDMRLADLIEYHDHLWFPSSDDVWVAPVDLSWLLELDHEEHARLFRTRS